jgi:iron complex outermembrane receptor protein
MYLRTCIALTLAAGASIGVVHAADKKLDEVIITSNRAPTALRDIPGSVSVMDAQEIQTVAATHHTELLNRAPGAMFQRNSGQESLTAIRSPVLAGPGSCGSFLFMEDSISLRPVGFCNVNQLFEVNMAQAQAVEVVRGPAGALYGSSAMHGAVNVLSMDPRKTPTVAVSLEGGEDTYARGQGVWSIGSDTNAFAIATNITHDGGWRDDSKVNEQKANAAWHVGLSGSTLDVRAAYARLDQDTAGFLQGDKYAYRNEALAKTNQDPEAYRNAHAARLNADWSVSLGQRSQLNVRPYARSSRMEFLQHFLPGKPLEENGQDSAGVSTVFSQTTSDTYKWLVGVDLEYADMELSETQFIPSFATRPIGKHYDYTVASSVAALYARDEWKLDMWTLTTGVRGEYVRYDYDNKMIDGNTREDGTPCLGANPCLFYRHADRTNSFTTVTPQFGALTEWTNDHFVYINATRGYRAPESTELYRIQTTQQNDVPQEESIESAEMGWRGRYWQIDYDVAVFTMRKKNLILREATGINIANGKTKHRGIEYSFGITPIEPLRLSFDGTHAQHTYDFNATLPQSEVIVAGRDVDTAPRNVWNARAQYSLNSMLTTEIEAQHVSEYWTDAANANRYDGHTLVNLRASLSFLENWRAAVRVTNLTDRRYADRADFAMGAYRFFPGRGRAAFLELGWRME